MTVSFSLSASLQYNEHRSSGQYGRKGEAQHDGDSGETGAKAHSSFIDSLFPPT
jgi:hypothetical protein